MYKVTKNVVLYTPIDGDINPYKWDFVIDVEFTDITSKNLDDLSNMVYVITNELNDKYQEETVIDLVMYISDKIKEIQDGEITRITCGVRHSFWMDNYADVIEYSATWDEWDKRWV